MSLFVEMTKTFIGEKLKAYIDDFNESTLEWERGEIKLQNVKLKEDCLRGLSLPVQLKSGWVSNLSVKIKLTALHSQPVKVTLEDVFVVAGTIHEFDEQTMRDAQVAEQLDALKNADIREALQREGEVNNELKKRKEKEQPDLLTEKLSQVLLRAARSCCAWTWKRLVERPPTGRASRQPCRIHARAAIARSPADRRRTATAARLHGCLSMAAPLAFGYAMLSSPGAPRAALTGDGQRAGQHPQRARALRRRLHQARRR